MSGSCPVSARVCQETARERESLRRWKDEALPVLDGLQELGDVLRLPLGSQITGPEALTAAARLTRERDEARDEVERLRAIESAIEALHVKREVYLCGAMSEVPHRHGNEREPYPIRPVVCTEDAGHEGPHKDAICCWNFQEFTEHAAYKSPEWADRSSCGHCQTTWPCPTMALLDPTEGEADV